MKKLSIFLPILFVVTLVFANRLFSGSTSKLVDKEISLNVYTNNNYSPAAYDSSLAQITVTVKKVIGNSTFTVAQRTYTAMQLKQYASAEHAMSNTFTIHGVKDNKETLIITYTVVYDTKGSKIIFEKNEVVNEGENQKKIDVVI